MDLFDKVNKLKINGYTVEELSSSPIYPFFSALSSKQDTEVELNGRRTIMLGSNNYLGLTSCDEVIGATIDAVNQFGSGCSGSRFLNGTMTLHLELEEKLAKFLNKPAVLTFSTGFGANLSIISALCGRNDVIMCDKENHASIYDACRLSYAEMVRYEHNDMKDLEAKLKEVRERKPKAGILIVVDGIFSMSGAIADLPNICKIGKKHGARIMVDDAHALGVLGKNLRGTAEHFNLEKEVDIYMGTFSKSMASLGGYMAGEADVVNFVKHQARPFVFTASLTPASAGAAIKAIEIMERKPELRDSLISISQYAIESYKKAGLPVIENKEPVPIVSILTGSMMRTFAICVELMKNGVYVNPVAPPAAPTGIIRTSYTTTHTREQIDKATAIIKAVFDSIPENFGEQQ